jgi:hypothetical protein
VTGFGAKEFLDIPATGFSLPQFPIIILILLAGEMMPVTLRPAQELP